jgi:hypothetical protein
MAQLYFQFAIHENRKLEIGNWQLNFASIMLARQEDLCFLDAAF